MVRNLVVIGGDAARMSAASQARRLLGVDVLATALWNRMQVEDLAEMDLADAPQFSPVWDPVLTAARSAAGNSGKNAR
jgi:hypothetical protein